MKYHILIILLFAFNMMTKGQNKTEEELFEELKKKMPLAQILGKYEESPTIKKLKELNQNDKFDTGSLYLNLEYSKPYVPAPTDIIPFGFTGGDGCYFAFLTDFGLYEKLDECPIIFISPTDFFDKEPQHANKVIARNIFDFLSILCQLRNPEITRFNDIKTMDFESSIAQVIKDHVNDSLSNFIGLQNSTIEKIKSNFNLPEIQNLNAYFAEIESERNGPNYLKLKDNLNIKLEPFAQLKIDKLNLPLKSEKLNDWLDEKENITKLAFYREAPYVYKHFTEEYKKILEVIINQMEKDGIIRESSILKFELEQSIISEKWLEIRRENLKNKR